MSERHTELAAGATLLQQRRHGWGSPVGLGLFLLQIGVLVRLLADDLSILSAI